MAQAEAGEFLLRIEDIDQGRSRSQWENQIYDDLRWLGLKWPEPVLRQSENMAAYQEALDRLQTLGVLYPCYCARRDIKAALAAPQEGVELVCGPDGPVYPGTCRGLARAPENAPMPAFRLDMAKAVTVIANTSVEKPLSFYEFGDENRGTITIPLRELIAGVGDVVLARRDMCTSYHLSVVVDDALQEITHVVRGEDLFDATKIHVVLQRLLNLPTPIYRHHKLIRDDAGKRLAKRDDARAVAKYRNDGLSPDDIRQMVGLG